MKSFLLYICRFFTELWQLPQHLVAYGFFLVNCKSVTKKVIRDPDDNFNYITYYLVKHVYNCGISLGHYIFFFFFLFHNIKTFFYEHGHQIQSLILGPIYLIFIGLPSVIGNVIDRIKYKYFRKNYDPNFYYKQPWEAWADKLGNVTRETIKKI